MTREALGRAAAPRLSHADDQLRLMAKIARMYHERGLRQTQIAEELHVSQARVSRLLKRAGEVGIVRTIVAPPTGVYTDVEEALERRFGMVEAVVVDAAGSDETVTPVLGAAAAAYLETTLGGSEVVGISSWSATLLAAVEAMRPTRARLVSTAVQLVGGIGDPRVQMQANRLMAAFAQDTGADPVFLSAPGLLGSAAARRTLMRDPTLQTVMELWPRLSMVLVGIGSLEPSPLLRESGNALPEAEQELLRRAGAVGDICHRFFDAEGRHVVSDVDDRIIGISAEQLRSVGRRVAVAGGSRKHAALLAAVQGGWVNVLITDVESAEQLLAAGGGAAS